ncbi:hypothetical protein ACFE04_015425 [Oxalis oulophora]
MEGSRGAISTSSHIKSGQIKIGSITINLGNESHIPNVGECEHFSIRSVQDGYLYAFLLIGNRNYSDTYIFTRASCNLIIPLVMLDFVEANTRGVQIPDLNMPYVAEDTSDPIVEMIGASENQYKLEDQPCIFNRNPADFSIPDAGNPYMIGVEDLKLQFPVAAAREAGLIKLDGRKRRKMSSAP